jgi:hypothetical protein
LKNERKKVFLYRFSKLIHKNQNKSIENLVRLESNFIDKIAALPFPGIGNQSDEKTIGQIKELIEVWFGKCQSYKTFFFFVTYNGL